TNRLAIIRLDYERTAPAQASVGLIWVRLPQNIWAFLGLLSRNLFRPPATNSLQNTLNATNRNRVGMTGAVGIRRNRDGRIGCEYGEVGRRHRYCMGMAG